jgi:PAS domain S-box-containing protein
MYVGDLASATDAIERLGVKNLQEAGETDYVFPFRVGVRKDWPEAVGLIDKVIASISPSEHQAIRRKWIGSIDGTWSLKRALTIAIPTAVGFAILILLLANRRLSKEVARRKETEVALRESEQRWAFALDGSRNGVWDWDVMTNDVFFSQRFRTILGFEEGELGNTLDAWRSRLHPDDARRVLSAVDAHMRGETRMYEVEHRLQAKDGSYRWVLSRGRVVSRDEDGKPLRVVGTQSDITERKEADLALQNRLEETVRFRTEELQRAEQRLKKITDTVSDSV